jgi:small redox-active disulfide protein 2
MEIIVAGPGCPRCIATENNIKKACEELGLEAKINHLYDVKLFPQLGIILTPAVVINGQVVVSGKVPTVEELKEILSKMAK